MATKSAVSRVALGKIVADAVLEEVHSSTATITDHPVETGSAVTDHVRKNPDSLRLTLLITNSPIVDAPAPGGGSLIKQTIEYRVKRHLEASVGGLSVAAPGPLNLVGNFLPDVTKSISAIGPRAALARDRAVYDELQRMMRESSVVTVVTSIRTYDNMAIAEVSLPRAAIGGAEITVNLRQLRFVSARIVDVPIPKIDAANKRADRGAKGPPEPAKDPAKSIAARLVDNAAEALGLKGP